MKKLLFLILVVFIACGNNNESVSLKKQNNTFDEQALYLNDLLSDNKIDEGKKMAFSMILEYPNEPTLYFIMGWIYDKKNSDFLKQVYFAICRNLYDKRIKEHTDPNDLINRACVTQILFGKKAYYKELDSLRNLHDPEYEKVLNSPLWDEFDYEEQKDQLFKHSIKKH